MPDFLDADPGEQDGSDDGPNRFVPPERRPRNRRWRPKDLLKRLAAISIKALARGTMTRWLPVAESTLYSGVLYGSDVMYFRRQFHNLMDNQTGHVADELAAQLRFKLLKVRYREGRWIRPGEVEWPLIGLRRRTRSAASSYFKMARWTVGVSRAQQQADAQRASIFVDLPPAEIGQDTDASDDLFALERLAVNEAHPEILREIGRFADALDAMAKSAVEALGLSDLDQWLLISAYDKVPNRELPAYLESEGISVDVGYKTLENRRKVLLARVVKWQLENAALVAEARAMLKKLEAQRDTALGKDPYLGERN